MKTLLLCYRAKIAVIDDNNPSQNAGYDFGKPLYYFSPEENTEPADENAEITILAELPDMDSWQIQQLNAILKQL